MLSDAELHFLDTPVWDNFRQLRVELLVVGALGRSNFMMLLTIDFCAENTGRWTGRIKCRFGNGYENFVVAGSCQELRGIGVPRMTAC